MAAKAADFLLTSPTVVSIVAGLPRAQVQRGGVARSVDALLAYAAGPTIKAVEREAVTELARNIAEASNKKK